MNERLTSTPRYLQRNTVQKSSHELQRNARCVHPKLVLVRNVDGNCAKVTQSRSECTTTLRKILPVCHGRHTPKPGEGRAEEGERRRSATMQYSSSSSINFDSVCTVILCGHDLLSNTQQRATPATQRGEKERKAQ